MSSYYVDGLFRKYTATGSFFPNTDRGSCALRPSGEGPASVHSAAASAFPTSLSGLYNVNNAIYQSPPMFTPAYDQGPDVHSLHCSSFDQSRLFGDSCIQPVPGPLTQPEDKHYRMYPWMRTSGMILHGQLTVVLINGARNSVKPLVLHGKNQKNVSFISSVTIN